ncbi:hypothetical protein CHS0354_030583 [Potamilus streckersoni]|uniref:Uncharacterized protein n=1 Tax=Potamilus streckersoni TaxID=2493646 RepID=A0AAE0SCD9_9BIVA|nr:hypothetical protein CHS0354_030583 [Potamilus streckersoni]
MPNSTILPARTILSVSNKNYLQLINPTSVPMHVTANTVLASVDVLNPQTIFTINEGTFDTCDRNDTPDIMNIQSNEDTLDRNETPDIMNTQSNKELGSSNLFTHRIETGDSMPVHCQPYRASPHINKEIDRQVEELL